MHQLVFTNRALTDIAKAKKWYNAQQENLGFKFVDYLFKCANEINKILFFIPINTRIPENTLLKNILI